MSNSRCGQPAFIITLELLTKTLCVMKRKYLKDCSSINEVKLKYKGYVEKYLPRKGHRGNRRIFKAVEQEYESIRNWPDFGQVMG